MNPPPTTPILVVEDSDEDFATLMRIFRKLEVVQPVTRCVNAEDCFDYLHATGRHTGRQREALPALMLLDLNLPGMDGHGVLRRLKAEFPLKRLPVVIITTSSNPKDIQQCYDEGASSYLIKPVDYATFENTIRRFIEYWFHAVQLPLLEA
jgi:CheY-like chemotaxis protein